MLILSEVFDFSKIDETAIIIAIVGWFIVMISLILLYFIFQNIPALIYYKTRKEERQKVKAERIAQEELAKRVVVKQEGSEKINAAISMALYLYFNELRDEESNIITIKKVVKPYSPWSSKIYGVMGNQNTHKQ